PQRTAGRARDDRLCAPARLRGGQRARGRAASSAARAGGLRVHPRSAAGSPAFFVPEPQGEVDLALPHRYLQALPAGLEILATRARRVRREHLLALRLRAALAVSALPDSAEHRSLERQEPRALAPGDR